MRKTMPTFVLLAAAALALAGCGSDDSSSNDGTQATGTVKVTGQSDQ